MKRITELKARKALPKSVRRLVLGTRRSQVEIARIAGCTRGYVWSVMHGRKAPSAKLRDAVVEWMDRSSRTTLLDMARADLGQMAADAVSAEVAGLQESV